MKTNKEKFKSMNSKQKLEYIWEYYRFTILGTIIGVLLVGNLVYTMLKPKPNFDNHLIVTAMMMLDTDKEELDRAYFKENFNSDIYYIPADWSVTDQATIVNDQMMMLKIQVREADVFAMSQARFDRYMEIEGFDPFMPLEEVPEFKPILEAHKDQLLTAKGAEDGKEHVYGIKIEKSNAFQGATILEPLVISLINPPKNMEKALEVVNYLLQ